MGKNVQPVSINAKPFVKWVGGKRNILKDLIENLPPSYNRYFEPFLGGGALFFKLQPKHSHLSDSNLELINSYQVIKNNVKALIKELKTYENKKEFFLNIRNADRTSQYQNWSPLQKASRFIFLNKTCFNGLYRVNKRGEFNAPFGHHKKPAILDEQNLLNCSLALQNTEIYTHDFTKILEKVKKNDFVYLDPPYFPLNNTSYFTAYTNNGFGLSMQHELKEICDYLNKKKIRFMLSNSDVPAIYELYADYKIKKAYANRLINSDGNKRGKVCELIVKNY